MSLEKPLYSSSQFGTNDGVERHPPPIITAGDDDNTSPSYQNSLSPYPYSNNNSSRISQNSEISATSNDNLFRDFSSKSPSPPKNYNTYPQTTELHPSRDLDSEGLENTHNSPLKKRLFRNRKRIGLICCGIAV